MSRRSVQGAYCAAPNYYNSSCVIEKSECSIGDKFFSTRQIVSRSSCLYPKVVTQKGLGHCADGTCSPNEASCGEMGFYSFNYTKTCTVENTSFGRCGDRCSWSPEDCDNENWTFPSQACSCDQVLTGACKKDNLIYCAVSPDGCDDESTWLSPLDVVSTTDVRCFLCREKSHGIYHDPYDYGKDFGLYDPVVEDRTEPSSRINIFIGGIAGGVFGAAMVLGLFLIVRKRQARTRKDDMQRTAPCASVNVSKTEDVSVLSHRSG